MRRVEYIEFSQVVDVDEELFSEINWTLVVDRKTGIVYGGFPRQRNFLVDDVSDFVGADPHGHWTAKKSI